MPEIELLGLIATGNPCEAVYEYFTQLLSDQVYQTIKDKRHGSNPIWHSN